MKKEQSLNEKLSPEQKATETFPDALPLEDHANSVGDSLESEALVISDPLSTETPEDLGDGVDTKVRPPLFGLKPEDVAAGIESFDDLPLNEHIRDAIRKIGWQSPTPVQKLCLPFTLRGRHVAGFAQTGTGKTAVFLITICHQLLSTKNSLGTSIPATNPPISSNEPSPVRAVVLAPTRELAMQIEQDAEVLLQYTGLTSLAVFGGIDYDKQAKRLKEGVDIIFATPGRLKDYIQKRLVDLSKISVFVCDEADRMFDMGFIEDVEYFLGKIPEHAQKLLFSATTNDQVKELAFEYLETPEYISVTPEIITPEKISQHAFHCHATQKLKVIMGLLRDHNPVCSIIFTNTKLTAEWLHFKLENNGIEADLITGDLPQNKRIRLIQRIKEGKLKALIATDVASRGLHISRVTHVYNFDLPEDPANYVHRIGRTARAGATGSAISLVCDDYGQHLTAINELIGPLGAMKTEWPPESYQQIEDKAGNPFASRYNQAKAPMRTASYTDNGPNNDSKPWREDRQGAGRGSENNRRPSQQNQKDRQTHGRNQNKSGQNQGFTHVKGPRQDRGSTNGGAPRSHAQGQPRQYPKETHATTKQIAKPVESPRSFFGMIKRLIRALFGLNK